MTEIESNEQRTSREQPFDLFLEQHKKFYGDAQEDALTETLYASSPVEVGEGVFVRRIKEIDEYNERQEPNVEEIAIVIGKHTTIEEIRNAWVNISIERDKLHKRQGDSPIPMSLELLQEIYMIKQEGSSYNQIAQDLNFDFGLYLYHYIYAHSNNDYESIMYSNVSIIRIFQALGIDADTLESWWKDGIDNFKTGKAILSPFRGPITRNLVVNKLRQYKKDMIAGKIIIKDPAPPSWTNEMLIKFCSKRLFPTVIYLSLLCKTYPDDYGKYIQRFYQRFCKAVDQQLPNDSEDGNLDAANPEDDMRKVLDMLRNNRQSECETPA